MAFFRQIFYINFSLGKATKKHSEPMASFLSFLFRNKDFIVKVLSRTCSISFLIVCAYAGCRADKLHDKRARYVVCFDRITKIDNSFPKLGSPLCKIIHSF